MKRTRRYGFTLIEVLVVVAIIALLVAILLPSLAKARKQAKTVLCQTNLHEIGQGIAIYVNDQQSLLPSMAFVKSPSGVVTVDTRLETTSLFQNNQFYLYGDPHLRGGTVTDPKKIIRPVNKYIHAKSQVYRCPFDDHQNPLAAPLVTPPYENSYQYDGNSYPYNVGLETSFSPTDPRYPVSTPDPRLVKADGNPGPYIPVLYMQKIESIKGPARLVEAGDLTSIYPQFFLNGAPHYKTFFTHDDKKQVSNLLFVDGHVSITTMRETPHHIMNSNYCLARQGTDPTWYGNSTGEP